MLYTAGTGQAQLEQQKQPAQQAEAGVEQAIANLRQTQARLGIGDGETFQVKDFSQVKSITAQLSWLRPNFAEPSVCWKRRYFESYYDQKKAQRDSLIGQLDEARSNASVAIRAINTACCAEAAEPAAASAKAGIRTTEAAVVRPKNGE